MGQSLLGSEHLLSCRLFRTAYKYIDYETDNSKEHEWYKPS